MSEENVEGLVAMLRAFNDGDVESFVASATRPNGRSSSDPGLIPCTADTRSEALVGCSRGERGGWVSLKGRSEGTKKTTDDMVIASLHSEGEGTKQRGEGWASGPAPPETARLCDGEMFPRPSVAAE